MQTLNLWHQFHLYWEKAAQLMLKFTFKKGLFIVVLFILCSASSFAQKAKNLSFYDDKKLHYGFHLGGMYSKLNLGSSDYFIKGDTTIAIFPMGSPGFSLGIVISFRLSDELWNLRLLPTVAFYERKVLFQYPNEEPVERVSDATYIELPILIKYKSIRRTNLRMYMIGGITASMKAGGKKKAPEEIFTVNNNLEVNYGAGIDWYFDLFKFAPEIRFSHGIPNILSGDNNPFAKGIGSVMTHKVSLYFNFE